MGKPFKVKGEARANVARAGNGTFQRLEQASPQRVAEDAKKEGDGLQDASRRERVPDHPTTTPAQTDTDDAVYEETIPWPEAGPYNDANKPPMKLRD